MERRPGGPDSTISNRLLAALSAGDLRRLKPHLDPVALPNRQTLLKPGMAADYIYFPLRGMVSLVQALEDGVVIEVGVTGKEGVVGALAMLATNSMYSEAMVQIPGEALRMPASEARKEASRNERFRDLLLRHVQALLAQISQSAACNGRHTVEQRLARWLLMARDCVDSNEFMLSHEFLAMMLARRRAGVTVAAGALKAVGLIDNNHGRIVILDRDGLEAAACECYGAIRKETRRLLA